MIKESHRTIIQVKELKKHKTHQVRKILELSHKVLRLRLKSNQVRINQAKKPQIKNNRITIQKINHRIYLRRMKKKKERRTLKMMWALTIAIRLLIRSPHRQKIHQEKVPIDQIKILKEKILYQVGTLAIIGCPQINNQIESLRVNQINQNLIVKDRNHQVKDKNLQVKKIDHLVTKINLQVISKNHRVISKNHQAKKINHKMKGHQVTKILPKTKILNLLIKTLHLKTLILIAIKTQITRINHNVNSLILEEVKLTALVTIMVQKNLQV